MTGEEIVRADTCLALLLGLEECGGDQVGAPICPVCQRDAWRRVAESLDKRLAALAWERGESHIEEVIEIDEDGKVHLPPRLSLEEENATLRAHAAAKEEEVTRLSRLHAAMVEQNNGNVALVERLVEALLAQALTHDFAGDPCFCGDDARNPPLTAEHIPPCRQARAVLDDVQDATR